MKTIFYTIVSEQIKHLIIPMIIEFKIFLFFIYFHTNFFLLQIYYFIKSINIYAINPLFNLWLLNFEKDNLYRFSYPSLLIPYFKQLNLSNYFK